MLSPVDLGVQLDISLRLLIAALLGAAIGFEREVHHPAGMRTHLLVSLGSAAFSVLGIYFFVSTDGTTPTDPSRIAAQIVSGIGFLGAGAILKYGTSVRGLTTAASLWATAAVGMAAGAGAWLIAVVTAILIVLSLGPLNVLIERSHMREQASFRIRLRTDHLERLGAISRTLADNKIELAGVSTERLEDGRYEIELELRPSAGARRERILATVAAVPDVEIQEAAAPRD